MATLHISFPSSDESRDFYAYMGRALSRWSVVEANVFRVFLLGLGGADPDAAGAAYHCAQAFTVRLAMADAAVSARFRGSEHLDEWHRLKDRCNRASVNRNKLAHWISGGNGSAAAGRRVWLSPSSDDPRKMERISGKPRPRVYQEDLIRIDEAFQSLANDIYDFCCLLEQSERPALPPASA
jgi:hypothetical protein